MPVFTGTPEKGIGLAYMVGPTGGYLLSYLAAAWIVGRAADKGLARNPFALGGVMLLAEAVILVMGRAGWPICSALKKASPSASAFSLWAIL